jgi:hypothetical protein
LPEASGRDQVVDGWVSQQVPGMDWYSRFRLNLKPLIF